MPLTLKALRGKTFIAECEVLGETVHLEFAPGRYTADVEDSLALLQTADPEQVSLTPPQLAAVRGFLLSLLVGWDVLDDDGKPIPITEDALRQIPSAICLAFMVALGEANSPDPQKAPPSDDSSATETTSSAPSPTGTRSSRRRDTSG